MTPVTSATPDAPRTARRREAAGHRGDKEPWEAVWGRRYAIVLDPDGCGVQPFGDAA